ncbi:helix-turn-helix domain-containing protein [Polynucleobacter sp. 71A-WALBACH]|uniref:IclR family transcriptional regulator n=1 Tax=Polynucleobacter sp. 71A-WALBACH TaxID=2689097 RepID=UPI001C0CF0CC|nr:helix-turn-helix domain-containing protein [Polynucleobacter sp. 71A-WALBACH]MBU3594300.1 helix-turn-helix domain-containing protein [Polynucleobacter sp. 71A-WALBACH]
MTVKNVKNYSSTIKSGIDLLRCFSHSEPVIGNKRLSELLDLPPSTVARITNTLCDLGLLNKAPHERKYQLGYGVLKLGYPVIANMPERHIARNWMKELTDKSLGQTSMAVLDNFDAVYVESFRPEEQWLSIPEIGTTRPVLYTAIGHALLYSLDKQKFNYLMNIFQSKYKGSANKIISDIKASFSQINECGYCIIRGTYRKELHAVGVPLTPPNHPDPIALNLSLRVQSGRHPNLEKYAKQLIEVKNKTLAALHTS